MRVRLFPVEPMKRGQPIARFVLQPRHACDQVGVGSFQDLVIVVAHQAEGVNLPAGFLARLGQGFDEILPVHIIEENVLATISTAHHASRAEASLRRRTCPAIALERRWMIDGRQDIQPAASLAWGDLHDLPDVVVNLSNEPCYGLTPFFLFHPLLLGRRFIETDTPSTTRCPSCRRRGLAQQRAAPC